MKNQRSMVISVIGRPNVGKSTIYNRLMNKNIAITHDAPGVTRDRHYGLAKFDEIDGQKEVDCILVDTGGFYPDSLEASVNFLDKNENGGFGADPGTDNFKKFFSIMSDHAKVAIRESDLVLFVVDIREGLLPYDLAIAKTIREMKRPFWVLANKSDSDKQMGLENEFYALGIDEEQLQPISAAHNQGINLLKRRIHQEILTFEKYIEGHSRLDLGVSPRENVVAKVAIIGAPNAGKSTLLNHLVGGERALVSDIPGTTVDPIQGFFDLFIGEDAHLLDQKDLGPRNNELLLQEYHRFRDSNPEIHHAMTVSYEVEQVGEIGGDETVAIDHVLEQLDEHLGGEIDTDELEMGPREIEHEIPEEELDFKMQELFLEDEKEEMETFVEEVEEEVVKEKVSGSFWRSVHLIDTAGIRKQSQVGSAIESESVYRALKCITESDIILYIVDATKGLSHQDRRLIDIALEKGKSVIVVFNKMDLLAKKLKDPRDKKEWMLDIRAQVPWLEYCHLIPVSAKFGHSLQRIKDSLIKTIFVRHRRVPTSQLNKAIYDLVEKNSINVDNSRAARLKVKYSSQVKTDPPTFLLFVNKSKGIPEQYKKYLKRGIRQQFKLINTPIHLIFRTGNDLALRMKKVGKKIIMEKEQQITNS